MALSLILGGFSETQNPHAGGRGDRGASRVARARPCVDLMLAGLVLVRYGGPRRSPTGLTQPGGRVLALDGGTETTDRVANQTDSHR